MAYARKRRFSRRTLIGAAGTALAMSRPWARVSATGEPEGPETWRAIRRVVTSVDSEGRGVVLYDGLASNARELNGTRITRLWEAGELPVELPLRQDAGATAGNAYRTGFCGTSFYVAELPGGAHAPSIPLHRNRTLDYMCILSGRVVLAVGDHEIELQAGDTIVQGGTVHTWINRAPESCVLLFVVVSGHEASSANRDAAS